VRNPSRFGVDVVPTDKFLATISRFPVSLRLPGLSHLFFRRLMSSTLSLLLVTAALSAVMLLVLSSLARSEAGGIRAWSTANWLAVAALPLFAGRGVLPDLFSIELANALYMLAIAMVLVGFRQHLRRHVPVRSLVATGAVALAVLVVCHLGIDSAPLRVVAMSAFHGGVCLSLGLTVRRGIEQASAPYPYLFTTGAAFALAFGHGVRGVVSLAQADGVAVPLDPATWTLIFFSLGTLAMPALTLGAVMMANADIIARATYAADHDHLTGAWSRRAFFRLGEHERARAARSGGDLSVLLFDVDHFKRINDAHGHAIGDQVLVDIVRRTGQVIREVDCCARLGGEEFAVLLPGAAAGTSATVAERLRAALQQALPVAADGVAVGYTVSIGIARLEPGESITELLCRADGALYLAKSAGRNTVVCAPAVMQAVDEGQRARPPAPPALAEVLARHEQF
jgi:diguanylate cyclase (GGDEF)-like protein